MGQLFTFRCGELFSRPPRLGFPLSLRACGAAIRNDYPQCHSSGYSTTSFECEEVPLQYPRGCNSKAQIALYGRRRRLQRHLRGAGLVCARPSSSSLLRRGDMKLVDIRSRKSFGFHRPAYRLAGEPPKQDRGRACGAACLSVGTAFRKANIVTVCLWCLRQTSSPTRACGAES